MSARFKDIILRILKTLLIPAVVYVVFLILAPGRFGTPFGLYVVLLQSVVPSLIGFGMAFNLLVGAWDLSGGAVVTLSAFIAAYATLQYGIIGLIVVCVVSAMILELLTGTVFSLLKIPSIIVTIGMMLIYESISQLYNGGKTVIIESKFAILGAFPYIFIILIAGAVLFHMIQGYTKFGYNVYSVGNSPVISKNIGINTGKVKFLCFLVGGIFMGLASIIYLSYGATVSAKSNMDTLSFTFTPIMGVILGMHIAKFCGLTLGIIIGEVTINLINSGLIATGMSANMQQIVTGMALLMVLVFTGIKERMDEDRMKKQLFLKAENVGNAK